MQTVQFADFTKKRENSRESQGIFFTNPKIRSIMTCHVSGVQCFCALFSGKTV